MDLRKKRKNAMGDSAIKENGFANSDAPDFDSKADAVLLAPYHYICQVPGKQIRGKLAKAFNYWLQIPDERLQQISEIIQMLHNASLMIDDIEDNSILRRGLPEHLLGLHEGQGLEIHWRDTVTCPTEEQYLGMVLKKTAALFQLAVDLMQLFSTNQSDFVPLVNLLGAYFQIRDDYANLCSKEYAEKKSFCEDITEGKFSFPVIHGISQKSQQSYELLNILRQRPTEFEVKKYFVGLLEQLGSCEYTLKKLKSLENDLLKEIEKFGGNPSLNPVILELSKLYS